MADSDRQTDNWGCQNHREKERKGKGDKNKLTRSEIWSGSLVVFAARSLMAYSDRQTDEQGGQNLRDERGKGKQNF